MGCRIKTAFQFDEKAADSLLRGFEFQSHRMISVKLLWWVVRMGITIGNEQGDDRVAKWKRYASELEVTELYCTGRIG